MDTTKKLAEYHFRKGKDRNEVAKILGISPEKLIKLFGSKKKLDEAEKSRELIALKMENALIKKACGYSYTEVKETEKESGTEIVTTTKECLPDVTAAKAWLENSCAEGWSSKGAKSSTDEKLDFIIEHIDKNAADEE